MTPAYAAFTERGLRLAEKLAASLPGSVTRCGHGGPALAQWTAAEFVRSDALVFVGAVGIAVRAIAPHCQSKASDPAVVVLDECGRFAVPILSGHLGGANDLARQLSALCGAVPVITTATDANGIFAVDEWAKHQNCQVLEPARIKAVSGKLLAGQTASVWSEFSLPGAAPAGVIPTQTQGAADFAPACICAAASIDLKQNEAGLLAFCQAHRWKVSFYSAAQLQAAPGTFTPSHFVQSVTGVDNVCERAAVLAAGGPLRIPKQAGGGVTFALALRPYAPDWRWQHE